MMASNKLGTNPATSVVSPEYRVWEVDKLYVIDGSIFPSSVSANPMQCIYTMAKIFADRHLGRRIPTNTAVLQEHVLT
jgi:choline dehydrogenase-like flavoprotein